MENKLVGRKLFFGPDIEAGVGFEYLLLNKREVISGVRDRAVSSGQKTTDGQVHDTGAIPSNRQPRKVLTTWGFQQ